MAKELMFSLAGVGYAAAPVKLERKKIYGWSDLVATDKDGQVCGSAYLSVDDALLIPASRVWSLPRGFLRNMWNLSTSFLTREVSHIRWWPLRSCWKYR